ncbi:MAG: hypothetical protein V4631_22105 [Pseudomonadota bacterium]
MSKLGLNREILENITSGNAQAIKALERVFDDVSVLLPDQIDAVINQAAQAVSAANQAIGILANLADMLEQLAQAPATALPPAEYEDLRPALQVGSIAIQEADNVDITGGTIGLSAGTVALPSFYMVDRTTGLYSAGADEWRMSVSGVDMITYKATGVTIEKPITSTVAIGTAPFVITSTTKVPNLHAERATSADEMTAPAQFVDPGVAIDPLTTLALANALRLVALSRKL